MERDLSRREPKVKQLEDKLAQREVAIKTKELDLKRRDTEVTQREKVSLSSLLFLPNARCDVGLGKLTTCTKQTRAEGSLHILKRCPFCREMLTFAHQCAKYVHACVWRSLCICCFRMWRHAQHHCKIVRQPWARPRPNWMSERSSSRPRLHPLLTRRSS